jgi:predicted enzyme related to lactoylglutathione lyase
MARVVHFEIAATDPEKVMKFYENAFGWKIEKWNGPTEYYMVNTGDQAKPGINGAITPREGALGATINTIDVPSFDDALEKVIANGGKAVTDKTVIPGVGTMCYCEDIEGNKFGIMEAAPNQVMQLPSENTEKPAAKPAAKHAAKPAAKRAAKPAAAKKKKK